MNISPINLANHTNFRSRKMNEKEFITYDKFDCQNCKNPINDGSDSFTERQQRIEILKAVIKKVEKDLKTALGLIESEKRRVLNEAFENVSSLNQQAIEMKLQANRQIAKIKESIRTLENQ